MHFLLQNEHHLKNKSFHNKLLKALIKTDDPFTYYLDLTNDTIHYLIFGKKTIFLQIIFMTPNWDSQKNFSILEYGIKRKKIAKNYLSTIDEVIQYNFILYENDKKQAVNSWSYKDYNLDIPSDFYHVYILNLYYILHHNTSIQYENLKTFWHSFL